MCVCVCACTNAVVCFSYYELFTDFLRKYIDS